MGLVRWIIGAVVFLALLLTTGVLLRDFSLHPLQMALAFAAGLATQAFWLKRLGLEQRGFLSAIVTCCGLSLLLRSDTMWAHPLAATLAMSSKFVLRIHGKHLYNPANLGVIAGLMFDAGKADVFLGLLAPHGLIELTAVFLAAAAGMRLGWSVVSPGNRPRGQVLAEQGRAVVAVAVGLVGVLLVAGLIEAMVTPSPLPTFVRIGVGVAAEIAFLTYVFHFGRKAVRAGETGDVDDAPDVVPTR